MSLHNDYLVNILVKQHQTELLARAAEERLARELPCRPAPWWRRLVPGRRRVERRRVAAAAVGQPAVRSADRPSSPLPYSHRHHQGVRNA